jgi:hypothetical protein
VRIQHIDVAALGLQERLHHFLALRTRELTGLRADHLETRLGGDDFGEAGLAIVGRRGANRALQFHDANVPGLILHVPEQPAAGATTLFHEV